MSASRTTATRSAVGLLIGLMLVAAMPATVLAVAGNDDRASAVLVDALPFSDAQDTSDATTAVDDPECAGQGPTVWYRYDADEALDLQANTFGSDYDTTLSVYVDDGLGGLIQLTCNDDWESLQSQVFWTSEPGNAYWLMVGSCCGSPGGNLVFNVDTGIPPPPPEPIDISVDILGATVNRSSGHVTVSASVTCSEEAEGYLFAELRQRVGRTFIRAYGDTSIFCGPEATELSLTTWYEDGVFAGGSILVTGGAEAFNEHGHGFASFEESVRARLVR